MAARSNPIRLALDKVIHILAQGQLDAESRKELEKVAKDLAKALEEKPPLLRRLLWQILGWITF